MEQEVKKALEIILKDYPVLIPKYLELYKLYMSANKNAAFIVINKALEKVKDINTIQAHANILLD